jgi:hypothetical protein
MALLIYLLSILNVFFSPGHQIHHRIGKSLSSDLIFASKIGGNSKIQYHYGLRPRRSDGLRVAASSASCCWKKLDEPRSFDGSWCVEPTGVLMKKSRMRVTLKPQTIALFLMNAELLFVVLLFRQLLT